MIVDEKKTIYFLLRKNSDSLINLKLCTVTVPELPDPCRTGYKNTTTFQHPHPSNIRSNVRIYGKKCDVFQQNNKVKNTGSFL